MQKYARRMLCGCAGLLVAAGAAGAAGAATAAAQSSSAAQHGAPAPITVTGCVERADQMNQATTAATTVDSLSFVLIHARSGAATEAPSAVGTSGAASAPTEKGGMYRLDAETTTLNPHVGQKVEVKGTLESAAPGAAPDQPSSSTAPRLKVETIKLVSETCDR